MKNIFALLHVNFIGVIFISHTDAACYTLFNNTHSSTGQKLRDVSTYLDCFDYCLETFSCIGISWITNTCYEGFQNGTLITMSNHIFLEKINNCNVSVPVMCTGIQGEGGAILEGITSRKACLHACSYIVSCNASSWYNQHCYIFSSQPMALINNPYSMYYTKLSSSCPTASTGTTEATTETDTTETDTVVSSPTSTDDQSAESSLSTPETSPVVSGSPSASLATPGQVMYGHYRHVLGSAPKPTRISDKRSRINCAIRCTKDNNCQGFDFNTNLRSCVLRTDNYEKRYTIIRKSESQ